MKSVDDCSKQELIDEVHDARSNGNMEQVFDILWELSATEADKDRTNKVHGDWDLMYVQFWVLLYKWEQEPLVAGVISASPAGTSPEVLARKILELLVKND